MKPVPMQSLRLAEAYVADAMEGANPKTVPWEYEDDTEQYTDDFAYWLSNVGYMGEYPTITDGQFDEAVDAYLKSEDMTRDDFK